VELALHHVEPAGFGFRRGKGGIPAVIPASAAVDVVNRTPRMARLGTIRRRRRRELLMAEGNCDM